MSRIEPIPDGALQTIARDLAESFTHARLTDLFVMARIEDDGTGGVAHLTNSLSQRPRPVPFSTSDPVHLSDKCGVTCVKRGERPNLRA